MTLSNDSGVVRWWRDAALQYFGTFSHVPLPVGVDPPADALSYFMALRCPVDEHRPRCEAIP